MSSLLAALIAFALTLLVLFLQNIQGGFRREREIRDLKKRIVEINAELAKTNEELQLFDSGKTEFVSIVSHQLRAPITAIKGHASMLLEDAYGELPDQLRKPVEKIFLSAERLVVMVADFLDLSNIEQGTMSYTFTAVDIKEMLHDIISEFVPAAKIKGLVLDTLFPEEEFVVVADEGKIRQIFSNLIDNSIKYTPKGKLIISLAKDPVRGVALVRLADTGIGLAQNDIYHIFGKFTRGAQGKKLSTDGSGLGLYIAKKMLEAQRGKIWVDSEGPGKGSTFVIELPLEKGE